MNYDWHQIIEDQAASGQTITTYCKDHSIPIGSFYKHKKQLKQTLNMVTFTPVLVEEEVTCFKINNIQFEVNQSNMDLFAKLLRDLIQ